MKNSGNSTHSGQATDPACFRSIATGIGQTLAASERTGEMRKDRVKMTAGSRSTIAMAPSDEGFERDVDESMYGTAPLPMPKEERVWRRS